MLDRPDYLSIKQSLAEVGFGANTLQYMDRGLAVELLATFAGQGPDLRGWARNAQINRDKDLRLQYLAGMYFNSYLSTKILGSILSYYRFPKNLFEGSSERIAILQQALAESGRR